MAHEKMKQKQPLQGKKPSLAMHKDEIEKNSLTQNEQNARNTLLFKSAIAGDNTWIKMLIGRGANVNVKDRNNWTPLMYAAREGHMKTCVLLLEKGADISIESNIGWTAFELAISNRKKETAVFLFLYSLMGTEKSETLLLAFKACVSGGP